MADSALFQRAELPRPNFSEADATRLLSDMYGFNGPIRELGSQQDRNYLIDTGPERFVLKICRAEYAGDELEAQNEAMRHLAQCGLDLRVPELIPALTGEEILSVKVNGEDCRARVLTYLDGEPLTPATSTLRRTSLPRSAMWRPPSRSACGIFPIRAWSAICNGISAAPALSPCIC